MGPVTATRRLHQMVMGHQKQTVDLDRPLMEVARKIRKTVEAVGKDFRLVTRQSVYFETRK